MDDNWIDPGRENDRVRKVALELASLGNCSGNDSCCCGRELQA